MNDLVSILFHLAAYDNFRAVQLFCLGSNIHSCERGGESSGTISSWLTGATLLDRTDGVSVTVLSPLKEATSVDTSREGSTSVIPRQVIAASADLADKVSAIAHVDQTGGEEQGV